MGNLIVKINDYTSYSDGVYLPSDVDDWIKNRIINCNDIDENGGRLSLYAATDIDAANVSEDLSVNDLESYGSSYTISSDSEWITIDRVRNAANLIILPNYGEAERIANIMVKHNTERDVYCLITITQNHTVYKLSVNPDVVLFNGINADTRNIDVTCSGGTAKYHVHQIKKYAVESYGDRKQLVKSVKYDNSLNAIVNAENENVLTIKSFGRLITDNSYYEVTIEHDDVIGLTQTIKVEFGDPIIEPEIPEEQEEESNCTEEERLPLQITEPEPDDDIVPSISIYDDGDSEIFIRSTDYCPEIIITTTPIESQIYFTFYGSFIDDYVITDYDDGNGNITHGLKIKAKENPFSIGRDCIGQVINAMYPQVRLKLQIHQEPNS